jgi:hypothetical protein
VGGRRALGLVVALALAAPLPCAATDLILSLGRSDFVLDDASDDAVAGVGVEFAPFASWRGLDFRLALATTVFSGGSYWAGGGLAVTADLGPDWFAEASLMPGYYETSDRYQDLGADLEFRSTLGIGRRLSPDSALSLAVQHVSNASTGRINPGVNLLTLRLRYTLP